MAVYSGTDKGKIYKSEEEILGLLLVGKLLKTESSPIILVSSFRLTDGTALTATVLLTSCNDTLHRFGFACAGLAWLTVGRGAAWERLCVCASY